MLVDGQAVGYLRATPRQRCLLARVELDSATPTKWRAGGSPYGDRSWIVDPKTQREARRRRETLCHCSRVRGLYFDNSNKQPADAGAETACWYRSFAPLSGMVSGPSNQLQIHLNEKGVLVLVVDNRRMLHGRTGFAVDPSGKQRHLRIFSWGI